MVMAKLRYAWRWFATAASFFVFGVGGILVPIMIVPVLYLLPGDVLVRERRGKKVIHHSFRFFIRMMKFLGLLKYQVTDVKKLQGAQLILANHPSLLDVVFLISLVPNASCIVKGKLLKNPFMHGPIKAAGYIVNEGGAGDIITEAAAAFDKGHALIIFPEGTRTTPSNKIQLQRGAANIAVRKGVDITPIIISCTPTTLTKSDRWYDIPDKTVCFQIRIKDKIRVAPYLKENNFPKGVRALTLDLTTYFNNEARVNE